LEGFPGCSRRAVTGMRSVSSNRASPHVGIVTFGFPPIPHVSGRRPSEMARYLVTQGYSVTVVTVDWRSPAPGLTRESVENGYRVLRVDPRMWHRGFQVDQPPFNTEPEVVPAVMRRAVSLKRLVGWGPFEKWARTSYQLLLTEHRTRPFDVLWAI